MKRPCVSPPGRGVARGLLGLFFFCSAWCEVGAQPQRYDHGDPTDHEQYLLQLVNAARANPSAEAARLGVDLNKDLAPGTITAQAKPPLVFHPKLLTAARAHSDWMLATGIFNHTGADGTTPTQRAARQGYTFDVAENIGYRSTNSALSPAVLTTLTRATHHALFRSAGHRRNLLAGSYAVAGFGTRSGRFDGFNAAMTTQKFSEGGASIDSGPFMTGVAYQDRNGSGSYDPGEGVAGVEVRPDTGGYYAVTSASGGYAIPIIATQTGMQTVNLPFAVSGSVWANVLPHDEAFRTQQINAAEPVQINLTWSGGPLSGPVRTTAASTRAVRINYRLRGTDGYYYDRTMVTTRSLSADLDISAPPAPPPPAARQVQTLNFSPLASPAYAPGRVVRPRARASSGLAIEFQSSDSTVAEVRGGELVLQGAGTATITARQGGNDAYHAVEASRPLAVRKARQTVIFPAPALPAFSVGATFELSARATSGEAVSYTAQPDGIVAITGSAVTVLSSGRVKIIATQSGTRNHERAAIARKLTVR